MKASRRLMIGTAFAIAIAAPWHAPAPSYAAAADAPAQPAAAAADASPKVVMQTVLHDIIVILRDPNLSREDKSRKVKEIAYARLDFETLSRLTLGRFWRTLNDDQHAQFVKEFREHLSATYGHTTDEYTDEDLNVTGDREEPNKDWTVQSNVVGTKDGARKEIAKVDYRLRQRDGQWKIIDVTIDGVSLVANFRSQFQDVMANGGFDRLIKLLREKNAAAAAAAAAGNK